MHVWSWLQRWMVGYGYRPALALIPLTLLVLAGSFLFLFASQHPDLLHPVLRPVKSGAPELPVGDHEIPQVGGVRDHVIPHPAIT